MEGRAGSFRDLDYSEQLDIKRKGGIPRTEDNLKSFALFLKSMFKETEGFQSQFKIKNEMYNEGKICYEILLRGLRGRITNEYGGEYIFKKNMGAFPEMYQADEEDGMEPMPKAYTYYNWLIASWKEWKLFFLKNVRVNSENLGSLSRLFSDELYNKFVTSKENYILIADVHQSLPHYRIYFKTERFISPTSMEIIEDPDSKRPYIQGIESRNRTYQAYLELFKKWMRRF